MKFIKVGDYVKYRSWKEGDVPVELFFNSGFDETGIVIWVGSHKFHTMLGSEPAIEYLNDQGHYVLAAQKDVEVVNEGR